MHEYGESNSSCPVCGWTESDMQKQQEKFPDALQLGMALGKRYLVGRVLRQDAFSILYVGWDELLYDKVCIEEFYPKDLVCRTYSKSGWGKTVSGCQIRLLTDEGASIFENGLKAFVLESADLHKIQRLPEIIQIYRVIHENNTAYRIMEFLEDQSLQEELARDITRNISADERFLRILDDVLSSLHMRGLGHLNLRPSNIFLIGSDIRSRMIKLTQFGMARAELHKLLGASSSLYQEEEDRNFIAPQILKGEDCSSEIADDYSYCMIKKLFPGFSMNSRGMKDNES